LFGTCAVQVIVITMAELNYDFRKRLLEVHSPYRRDFDAVIPENSTVVTDEWKIVIPCDADKIIYNAARDLEEYFFISMKLSVKVVYDCGGCASKVVTYAVDPSLGENEYRVIASEDKIAITGADSRSAAQGGYWVEDLMNLNEAPYVEYTDIVRKPLYSPRMIHSGFGLDMFPDEHIRSIAHHGINALLVFVKDVDTTPHGYVDFNDLIYRAGCYGVDVYCYSYMKSRRHPDDPKAEEFYEGLYGRLFDRCPGFKGIVFVGESCEFPSNDPHTSGMLRLVNRNPDGTNKTGKIAPGWWPCYDFDKWVKLVKGIIQKRKPDVDFVFWTYNWGGQPEADRLALIDSLPTDISLLVTFEMKQTIVREGVRNYTVDYNLWFEGPGDYFVSEAKRAKERGIRLYTMSNTGGRTWDIGVVPFEPAPQQWMRRYAEMQKAHDNWGLCGTMDSHHFGYWPSFIAELAKWAFYAPVEDYMSVLRRIVKRDFGAENVDTVIEAYDKFSDGIRSLVSTDADQYGPFRIGPSYPLTLNAKYGEVNIPTVFYAHFGGNHITNPIYAAGASTPEQLKKLNYEIKEHSITRDKFAEGAAMLDAIIDTLPERKKDNARRIAGVAHFFSNAARTTVNTKEWQKRKVELKKLAASETPLGEAEKARIEELKAEMKAIGLNELENAKATIPYVEFDSALGFEPSMEYMTDRAHIEWKLGVTEQAISELDLY